MLRAAVWAGRCRRVVAVALVCAGWVGVGGAEAQRDAGLATGPKFLMARPETSGGVGGSGGQWQDASRLAVLQRRIALELNRVPLGRALAEVARKSGLKVTYSPTMIEADAPVTLSAPDITVGAALSALLYDAGVDVLLTPSGQAAIVERVGAAWQAGVIVGRVTDAKTGEGMVGAEVVLEGGQRRGMTGEDGRYRLGDVAPGSYTLAVRRIGYRRESRPVTVVDGQEVTVDVALEAVPTQLDEVVTTVTGEQRLRELGHVVGRINADSLVKEAPVSSLSELLNGRVPGLQVFQSQGTVGGQVRLQVRGANSFNLGSEPIVIIDGVRHTTAQPLGRNFYDAELTSRLNDLNPNDIESIEVVKGPSAATLYGTDAANGVLVITTKRGRPGPARWNVYAKSTTTEIPSQTFPDIYWGWGTVFGVPDNSEWSCTLAWLAADLCTQQDSITVLPNPLNDPELTFFGSKPRWEYGANVAGGRQDLRYYFSGDYEDASGPLQMPPAFVEQLLETRGLSKLPEEWREPNAMTKLNLRANVTAGLGKAADLRVNTGYVHGAIRSLVSSRQGSYTGAFRRTPASMYADVSPAEMFLTTSTERTDRFFGSANGQWRPAAWLTTRATVGLDLANSNRYTLARRGDVPSQALFSNGRVGDDRTRQVATTAELGATATFRLGRLTTRTAVGAQYVRTLSDVLQTTGGNLPPGGTSVGEAADLFSQQSYSETVTLGSYLEETVGLNDRLFLTAALRVDGASAFGQDYDATGYPKVSASWLVSEEPFLPRVPGLDELRLRYAYGASGQQPTSAMARPVFVSTDRGAENGTTVPMVRLDRLGNANLRPERVREHEFGFDATALQNRLQLGLTWYHRRTVDQLVSVPLAPGFGSRYANLGLTTQHGFEVELTARVLETRLVSWDFVLQHGLHRTKLVDLGGASAFQAFEGGWAEGYPLGARFARPVVGYDDANGDGFLALHEVQFSDEQVYMGESAPPESQTLTTTLGLFERRLRLSALVERRSGFTQLNAVVGSTDRAAVDPSTPLAEQAEVVAGQRPERADFTRLREVAAAMDLPVSWAQALRLRSATLALSVRNLALWTDFSGPDPESAVPVTVFGGPTTSALGSTAVGIPQGRTWSLRLDLGL